MPMRFFRTLMGGCAVLALAGCMVGPDYKRPSLQVAPAFKEKGWTPAEPADLAAKGDWWTVFDDPTLNALEARVAISNQNVAAAEAAYRQSEALVREQRSQLFPLVTLDPGASRSGGGVGGGGTIVTQGGGGTGILTSGGGRTSTSYRMSVNGSWSPDIWGRIRRSVESARGQAQASEADLAAARLSAQGSLAANYLDLRLADAQIALLTDVVAGYQRAFEITNNRYNAGIAPHSDVLQARTQLTTAQANLSDLGRTRAAFEHAIAVLMGETPEAFSLAADPKWTPTVPQVPTGVPSTLLQRRPDVASAERQAAAASAQIGVAVANYFPDLTLTGSYGFAASELGNLFASSASVWSYGVNAGQTLFAGGQRGAQVDAARAAYDQAAAQYRQTALTALQEVEDQLAATRILAEQYDLRRQAAEDADLAATMVLNQYKAGQVDFTSVVTAQNTALTARQTLLQAANARQAAAVSLIQALGGGWTAPF